MASKVVITMGFGNGSDYTQEITFAGVADSVIPSVKTTVQGINSSLAGGTDGGLGTFFEDEEENSFSEIKACKIVTEEVTELT